MLGYLSQFLNLYLSFFFNSFQLFLMLSDYILVKILVVINTFVICWSLLPLEKLWSSQSLIVIICGERNNCFNFGTWLRFGFEVILEIDKLFMLPARILSLINLLKNLFYCFLILLFRVDRVFEQTLISLWVTHKNKIWNKKF